MEAEDSAPGTGTTVQLERFARWLACVSNRSRRRVLLLASDFTYPRYGGYPVRAAAPTGTPSLREVGQVPLVASRTGRRTGREALGATSETAGERPTTDHSPSISRRFIFPADQPAHPPPPGDTLLSAHPRETLARFFSLFSVAPRNSTGGKTRQPEFGPDPAPQRRDIPVGLRTHQRRHTGAVQNQTPWSPLPPHRRRRRRRRRRRCCRRRRRRIPRWCGTSACATEHDRSCLPWTPHGRPLWEEPSRKVARHGRRQRPWRWCQRLRRRCIRRRAKRRWPRPARRPLHPLSAGHSARPARPDRTSSS